MIRYASQIELRNALHAALRRGSSVVLATISMDDRLSTAYCSWVLSLGIDTIAVAVDSRSTAYRNISDGNHAVALEVMADDLIVSVRGGASVVKEQLQNVPFPCALITVAIAEVRDHSVLGVHFKAPQYIWADGKEHRGEVERAIFEELAASGINPAPDGA